MNNFNLVGELECVWDLQATCGEGPVWIESEQSLYFVDIDGQKLHCFREEKGSKQSWSLEEKTGWILPRSSKNGFVAGCETGMYFLDPISGKSEFVMVPDPDEKETRFNDAKCDINGRIWAGRSHDPESHAKGWLYRIDPDLSFTRWDGPYICPNGPAISLDDKTLYHVDTFGSTVWAFDKDNAGVLTNRREFVQLDQEEEGFPDGLTVDIENRVWLAHWGGARITCFSPGGNRIGRIDLPVPQVTSCAFGGADLSTLYITTAARNLDMNEYPMAGALFRVPTNTAGATSPSFDG